MNPDVLLINPIDKTAVKNGLNLNVPPLNLMYLAGALEEASISVEIFDDDVYQIGFENITNIVSKINPIVVGLTATTATIKESLNYIRNIKKELPNILTVIGGPHTTFLPVETLKKEKALDVVVIGEGEETLVELTNKYLKNNNDNHDSFFHNIKGIAYRNREKDFDNQKNDNINEKIRVTEPRPLIENLDELPFPARHLVPFESYELSSQSGGMITSRGCVFSCDYCSSSLIMGKKFRTRSPENIVNELEELVYKYNLKNIAFLDDIFMLDKRRAKLVANEIKERKLDIRFVASSRVNTVNKSLLEILKSAGMNTLYCGVESGSQRVLDLMKKGITLKQAQDAFKTSKNVGINIVGSFILGYPGETAKEMDETINFSLKLDPDYSQYSILTPFPGTPIYSKLNQENLLENEQWDNYTVLKSVIKYEEMGLSKRLVERKLVKAYLKFYTRPKYLIKHKGMFEVLTKTIYRSFIRPFFKGGTPKGWYDNLK
jgi:radical SAM superfamily enzyme YgiQ (UPF0313 family)